MFRSRLIGRLCFRLIEISPLVYFGLAYCLFQGFNVFLGLVGWSVLGLLKDCLESMQVF